LDSLSQIVLGAACGELILGRKIGNKAQLLGAIAGTIPDLDVLLNPLFSDELTKLQIHRSYSHSMFIHLILALPFAWLTWLGFKKRIAYREWYIMWLVGFVTHTLLDCCTTYGTQLLLPFTNHLIGFNNIAVVDPFWTLPFMLLLIVCLFMKRDNVNRFRWALVATTYCFVYMGYTLVNKYNVHQHFQSELTKQQIQTDVLYTSPSMFNNWLWAGIATTHDTLYCGEFSTLQNTSAVEWVGYPRNLQLLENHPAKREIEVLQWFAQEKYFVQEVNGELHFFITKWGRADFRKTEPHEAFVFYWRLFQENGIWKAAPVEPDWGEGEFTEAWNALWRRVKTSDY
jgi:inner membrane protein